jgi:putative transposase
VLGLWAGHGAGESAKFWMGVLTDLRNRGVTDVFFIVCDGLKGLPDSVNAVFPLAIVQACVIHLVRATLRYASRTYWDQLARDLKAIYTAPTEQAAWASFEELEEKWGKPYTAIPKLWRAAWQEFTPFLAYGACCEIACCAGPAAELAGRMGRGQGVPSGVAGSADVVAGGHAGVAA